jgi:restriction system protein
MPPRPATGAGRPPPARPQRSQPATQRRGTGADQQRRSAEQRRTAEQLRRTEQQRRIEQQRRGSEQRQRADLQRRNEQHRWVAEHQRRAAQPGQDPQASRSDQPAAPVNPAVEAELRTGQIRAWFARLESILAVGMERSARIDLDALPRVVAEPEFDPGPLAVAEPEPSWRDFAPTGPARWGSRARRDQREAAAREAYHQARDRWKQAEQERVERLAAAEQEHQQWVAQEQAEVDAYNARIARVAAGLRERDPAVVESFLRTVLLRVPLPPGFPRRAEVTHHPDSERVTLRMVLPGIGIVPEASRYEHSAPTGEVRPVPLPDQDADELYHRVIAQVALLVVRDILAAEPGLHGVSFEGLIEDTDPETNQLSLPVLVSFRAGREEFAGLDLAGQPAPECLDLLDARFYPDREPTPDSVP